MCGHLRSGGREQAGHQGAIEIEVRTEFLGRQGRHDTSNRASGQEVGPPASQLAVVAFQKALIEALTSGSAPN